MAQIAHLRAEALKLSRRHTHGIIGMAVAGGIRREALFLKIAAVLLHQSGNVRVGFFKLQRLQLKRRAVDLLRAAVRSRGLRLAVQTAVPVFRFLRQRPIIRLVAKLIGFRCRRVRAFTGCAAGGHAQHHHQGK